MRNTWRTLNSLLGKAKKQSAQSIKINGALSYSSIDIADAFNDFFTKVPKKLHAKLPKRDRMSFRKYLGPRFQHSIFFKSNHIG